MDREQLIQKATDYAGRLIGAGDLATFEEVFGSADPDFDVSTLSTEDLQFIYNEYLADEG